MSEKNKKRVGPFKWLLLGVAVIAAVAVIFWPRSVIVSGQVGDQFQGETVDLRLSVYDTESSSDPVQIVDYDGVRTTSDGRFDLIYRTSLFGLPTQSYMQLCIKTNMELADWNEAIPPCHEETTAASPTASVQVKGVNTISGSAVSCTRREITSGVPGVLNRLFGNQKNRYEFYNFCDDTYTNEEFSNIVITQEITQAITNQVEPQKLSLKEEELSISQGNSITLPEGRDEQELVLDGDTLSISGGNEVVIDATADPFSVLTGSGLSGGGQLNEGETITLENTGVLSVGGAGPITSTGGQNPEIDLTLCANGEVLQVAGGVWTCNTTAGTYTFSIFDGVTTEGIAGGDTITFAAGNGLQTAVSATDTVTYSVPNQGIDTLQLANDAVTSTQILNGSVANADLANDSITVTAGTGLTGGGVAALGGAVVLNASLGTAIDTSEITDGTLVFADFAQNGCSGGQTIEWGGAAWICGTDDVNDADSNASNELQNLFETVSTPGGTDPVADSLTDTLAFANGSGVTITGDAGTDTVTIAAVLGTSIDSSEVADGTLTFADINANGCSAGEIFEYSGAAWTCGTDDDTDTTYSAGTGINFAGTVISSTLGTSIDSSEIDNGTITSDDIAANTLDAGDIATGAIESTEILNGTILFEDLAANGCASGEIIEYNGSAWICGTDDSGGSFALDVTDGSTTETLNNTDTLTFVDGAGIDVTVSATDTVTIAALLGTSIDSSEIDNGTITSDDIAANTLDAGDIATGAIETGEILNGTILFEDLSGNSCSNGQIIEYNGSAWICGTDDDTDTTYSAGTGISIIGTVISSTLGTSVESSEITNGTILFEDIASNSCSSGEIFEFNGSVWVCGTDDVNDADSNATNELQNIFTIINAPNGTNPEVDSQTDTLNFADGSGITVTGDASTDTLTIAATLGTAIDTSEITNGTILFADLAQNGCSSGEVVEWNGSAWACDADDVNDADANATNEIQNLFETFNTPSGTDPVADSSTDTLNFAAGTNITITGDSATDTVTIDASFTETDGVIGNEVFDATANGGLVRSGSGTGGDPYTLGLRTDCSSGEVVQFNGTAWVCDADDVNDADSNATNELQNLFSTIDAPGGTDPVVDSQTDTLTFANGSGVTITGDAGTDTLTIAAVLGTTIDNTEIVDGTITFADIGANGCSSGEIFEYSGAAWACGTDDNTTYSAGTGISFAGTVINSTLGTAIETGEITNGTILFEDLAANGCSSGETIEYNGSAWICGTDDTGATSSFDVTDGSTTETLDNGNTLTFVDGSGIDVTVSATDTVTVAALLGSSIDSSEIDNGTITSDDIAANTLDAGDIATGAIESTEILNGTILFEDLSGNSCSNGQIIEYNGSAWVCGTDDDTDTTYSAGTGISIIGTVISSTLGTAIETGEITNGTILFEDLAANGCSSSQVIEYNGSVWICGTDDVNDADSNSSNELQNIFTIINAPNGTNPEVDSQTDTLNFADGSGITVTGDATTDTLTIASTLGTAIDSSEITDGAILFADLNQNGCSSGEVVEWNGSAWACDADDVNDADANATNEIQNLFETFNTPSGTDPVADSSTDTLNFAAGTNITITGDSATDTVTIDASFTETDGVIGNEVFDATANGGLVRSGSGTGGDPYTLGLRTDCSSGEVVQFNGSAWVCDADDVNDADANATNELQNLFSTIDAPGGTDPVVDSQTDTLTFANGSGVTITGDAGTDTLTIAAVLGTAIDSSEITDGAITFADINANGCSSGEIFEYSGAAWTCGADDDTTYSAGTGINFAGTVISSTLGTAIETGEITNGTILFEDLAVNGCSSGEVIEYNGSAWICGTDDTGTTSSFDITDGSTTETVANGNTLTFVDGTGIDVTVSATDTVTVAALLGTSIDSSEIDANTIQAGDIATGAVESTEILNGTILFEDIAANGCSSGEIFEYNGSAWTCGTDDDTTYSAGTGINFAGTVISSTLGTSVETGEITNATILFEDLAANGCSSSQIIEYNGSVWICGTDDVNDADASASNELQNIFTIINAPNGTNPEVDSQTDTLNFADGSGITITGDSSTDTLTIAATLGTAVDTSEITNGTILFADLSQNGCSSGEIMEWNGSAWACDADDVNDADANATNEIQNLFATFDAPSGTDPVADSATDTIQFVAGANISITGDSAADSLTIASSFTETDGIIGNEVVNATTNGGLERAGAGTGGDPFTLGLRTDCADNEILKWDNGGSAWGCEVDDNTDGDSNSTNELQNVFTIIDTPNGTDPTVDSQTDTLTLADGTGITITGTAATDTIAIAATLGTSIDSSEIDLNTIVADDIATGAVATAEILNGTILLEDIGQNGCNSGEVMEWNGSAWACDADDTGSDQNLFETFATSNGTSPVADSATDTVTFADGSGITVTGDSSTDTITIASVLGTNINSTEILNGTILFEDLAANGCSSGQVIEYNGSVWICGTDDVNDADSSTTNELQNIFTIINAPNGTNPEVDSQTDTLNFADGSGITITGDNTTDTLTIAATLGTAIDSSEITDGVILFADLNQNGCSSGEVIEWNGSAWACDADDVNDADSNATNEIQNLFATFDAPSGTDPVADSSTDTIQFVAGANISITGDSAADSLTIASSFTEVDGIIGNEVVNATANGGLERTGAGTGGDPYTLGLRTDCADNEILQWDNGGSAWACDTDDVNDADASATNELQNIFQTIDAPNGTDPVVDSQTDTLSLLDGSGITITGSAAADSITIAAVLGATIESSEITNGTILLEDIGQNGCTSGDVMEWNGSAWACDADDTGGTVNSFETVNVTSGTNPVADSSTDTLNLSAGTGLTVTGDSSTDTITLASVLGTGIDSAEILNGTILFEDLAANGCSSGQVIEYNGSVWLCGTDDVNDADASITNELQNIFTIINAPNGTNPEVDGQTDTLNFADGSGITVTGDSSTDTLTIAATLGTAIDTSEITNGTILFADLSQNGCSSGEVIEWNGSAWACDADDVNDADSNATNELQNLFATIDTPTGTDPVVDSQTDTLQFLAGSNITITGDSAADSVTIAASFTEVDGVVGNEVLNATTDGGLTRGGAGTGGDPFTLGLRTDCADNEILKWDNGGSAWGCEADVDTNTDTNTFASLSVDGANQSTGAIILDFDGTDFAISETPADTFDITIQSERIEDIIGAGVSGNTETGIAVTYQDSDGTFDFVVDNLENLAGTLDVASGGTGLTTIPTNGVLYGNGTSNVGVTSAGTGGQVLLANGSGVPTFTTIGTDITIDASGAATIQSDAVALGTDTTGNYVATISSGNGITGTSTTEGGTPTVALGPLTADWDQTGAFDIVLNNSDSQLSILENVDSTFFGTLDVDNLTADRTYTLPDADGEVSVLGQTISDAEVDDNITIGATGTVNWAALSSYPSACGAGTAVTTLGDTPTCTAFNTDTSITLQDAYNEGSLITTSDANDLDIVLNDDTTDSNLDIDIEADNLVSISRLDNASVEAPAQLLLLENLDTDLPVSAGLTITDAGGGLTNAIDASDPDITNALAVGDNVIQGGTAVIDFTNFDVLGNGNTTIGGTLDTTGTANLNGNVNLGSDSADLLTVNATLHGTNALVFEGSAADGNETTFAITNPTSPQTVTFPDATGEVSLLGQTIANSELVNDSLTITSGAGLTGGGSVDLGASVNVDIGAGAGITVNADDVAVDVLTTGTTVTTSSNSGLETDASGVRLLGGCANGDVLAWNAASSVWECSANDGIFTASTSSNQVIGNTTTLTNVTGMSFNVAANEEWYFEFTIQINADANDDLNVAITCPAGATASFGVEAVEQTNSQGDIGCGTRSGNIAMPNGDEIVVVSGTIQNSTTAGTVQLQLSENSTTDAANNLTIFSGSALQALRIPVGTFVAGSGGSFDISDSTNTETVSNGDTITFAGGTGMTVLVSGTDTVTYTAVLGTDIDNTEIVNDTIGFAQIADTLTLDAVTTISAGANSLIVNLNGAGDFIAQDNGTPFFTLLDSGNILLDGNAADTVELRFGEDTDNGTNYVGFKAPASVVTNLIWTLPNVDGSAGDVLATNGSGLLQWQQGLRTDCADNEILRWNNGGSTWVCDDPVYEKIVIWAEENASANTGTSSGNQWSFGNGAVGAIGIPLAESWEIYAVTFDAETFGTSVSIDVVNRNGGAVLHSFTATTDNYTETLGVPVSVSAGDTLGFDTTATSGTSTDLRAAVWLRRLP